MCSRSTEGVPKGALFGWEMSKNIMNMLYRQNNKSYNNEGWLDHQVHLWWQAYT